MTLEFNQNLNFVAFDGRQIVPPNEWKSNTARKIYEAGADACRSGAYAHYVLAGTFRVARRPTDPEMVPYGSSPEIARSAALQEAERLEAKAKLIRQTLDHYGPSAFIQEREAITAPRRPADAEQFILSALTEPYTHVEVCGKTFVPNPTGGGIVEATA